MITSANSLDLDHALQHDGPDLNQKCLAFWWQTRKNGVEKDSSEKKQTCIITQDAIVAQEAC